LLGVPRIEQESSQKNRLLHVKGLECLRIRHEDVDHRERNTGSTASRTVGFRKKVVEDDFPPSVMDHTVNLIP